MHNEPTVREILYPFNIELSVPKQTKLKEKEITNLLRKIVFLLVMDR